MRKNNPDLLIHMLRIPALLLVLFLSLVGTVSAALVDNGDGTVTDTATCLMWQQATMDLNNDGTPDEMTWEQALDESEHLILAGYSDWRLPDYNEFVSIVDYSRYHPAIDTTVFPDTVSSDYWSSTTNADYAYGAWCVNFYHGDDGSYDKSGSNYVRAVRGGQCGAFADLSHFEFAAIGDQTIGVQFAVTVTARNGDGSVKTDVNGVIELSFTKGRTDPERVTMVDGQWSGSVTLFNWGNGQLAAAGQGLSGSSNIFASSGAGTCTSPIMGRVVDLNKEVVYQATVELQDAGGTTIDSTTTDTEGVFEFPGPDCGTYTLSISKDAVFKHGDSVTTVSNNQCAFPEYTLPINRGSQGTPVILIPGILESTSNRLSIYPTLPKKTRQHNLSLYKPGKTGFKTLRESLQTDGYTVFDCPWDWRMQLVDSASEYLEPMVTHALTYSTTGKVHIVAHSMGGLVARAWIQRSGKNAEKVDRFAMVGTPNQGSCNAYYIWEGGDPKLIDDISDHGFFSSLINFYSNTIQTLWVNTYHIPYWSNTWHKAIKDFVQDKSPSLRELMPTEKILMQDTGNSQSPAGVSGPNINSTLQNMNSGENGFLPPQTVMSSDGSSGTRVQVGLFVGSQTNETVAMIPVGKYHSITWIMSGLWEDGQPRIFAKSTVIKGTGDGTVPYTSAVYPAVAGWANLEASSSQQDHGYLVSDYVDQLTSFLSTGSAAAASKSFSVVPAAAATPETPRFSIAVQGTVRLDVTGPSGSHAGADPATGVAREEISGSTTFFNGESGSVRIDNPVDGTYQVVIFGADDRDFHGEIGFQDDTADEYYPFQAYYGNDQITFQVVVNSGTTPRVTVVPSVGSPEQLKAEPAGAAAAETTTLSWDASTDPDVNGYSVYSITETAPYFSRIATVALGTTSYATSDPWAGDASVPVMSYTVTALKTDGSESFFSNIAQNNDRDHDLLTDVDEAGYGTDPTKLDTDGDGFTDYEEINAGSDPLDPKSIPAVWKAFPWSMFLPAITGAGR